MSSLTEGWQDGMKIVGVITLNRFPLWQATFSQLLELCEKIYVRFDTASGDPRVIKKAVRVAGEKLGGVAEVDGSRVPEWREEMIKMLDDAGADIVLCPDEDERFGRGIRKELNDFWHSDKMGMMFRYRSLMAADGREINKGRPYPSESHMKAFKWMKGLSYYPYHGRAIVSRYCHENSQWNARTRMEHYCCWTPAMEKSRDWGIHRPTFRETKAVTLLGFGPTSHGKLSGRGEVWSLNNCYEVFSPDSMKYITRIFDMHKFGPRDTRAWKENARYLGIDRLADRNKSRGKDGRLHIEALSELGGQGRRIIMQEPHPRIKNSEAFPLDQVISRTDVDWFLGTPCYMVAMAILENYTRIDCYGLDQMDWEHNLQRECFAGWMMYAAGRGIKLGGCRTWLDRFKQYGTMRYGYHYGPEWCEWCDKILWQGFPIRVKFKEESRIIHGDMFQRGRE